MPASQRPTGFAVFARNRFSLLGLVLLAALVALALAASWIAPFDPHKVGVGPTLAAPDARHWFGTDDLGRDVASRVLAGTGVSLLVGFTTAVLATLVGVLAGAIAGFAGARLDDLLMRVTEVFLVIPRFFLAILLVAFFGASLLNLVLTIAILSWPEIARLTRAEFLTLRSRQFVDAARVAGASRAELVFGEILPNALGPVIVASTLLVGQAMLLEAGLSYLGLGDPGRVSLGLMLHQAQSIMRSAWWATAAPGLAIFVAVIAVNLIGDGLNDLFNPRARER
ncbi:MAG: ABC transporter permease [Rubrivivax sp.]|nr:ABC transporter permease [Rubrivivax sp.]